MNAHIFKLLRLFFCVCQILLKVQLQAQDVSKALVINSGEAFYDGKEVILTGDVVVEHSLGTISAHRFSMQSCDEGKTQFSLLNMLEDVHIHLTGGGEISCQKAIVDYGQLQGDFYGNALHPSVIYSNENEKSCSQQSIPLVKFQSSHLVIFLERNEKDGKKQGQPIVKQIDANEQVKVEYDQRFFLNADYLTYYRLLQTCDSKIPAGLLTLGMYHSTAKCLLTTLNRDEIQSRVIVIDTLKQLLNLEDVIGRLNSVSKGQSPSTLNFSSKQLQWDELAQKLTLIDQVQLNYGEALTLKTDKEIIIHKSQLRNTSVVTSLVIPERLEMTYVDSVKEINGFLSCPGSLVLDNEKYSILLKGLSAQQDMQETHQVYLKELEREMYADEIRIDYNWDKQVAVFTTITLLGHVRVIVSENKEIDAASVVSYYALADSVTYFPEKKEMLFEGTRENPVLLFDEKNHIQMSANVLVVQHDGVNKKPLIQGKGHVRFTFRDSEVEQFKQAFQLDTFILGK